MPEPEAPTPKGGKDFFTQKIAGAPLIVWVAGGGVLAGGILWWRNRQQAAAGQSTATSAAGAVPTANTSEELMAAGLYQPPNITYNMGGESPVDDATQPGNIGPLPAVPVAGIGPVPVTTPPVVAPPKPGTPPSASPATKISNTTPPVVAPKYITVTPWPTPTSTLWGISQKVGIPLARIEALNPQIKNPNLIHAGESIRYA